MVPDQGIGIPALQIHEAKAANSPLKQKYRTNCATLLP
jgi:hypothetical protein